MLFICKKRLVPHRVVFLMLDFINKLEKNIRANHFPINTKRILRVRSVYNIMLVGE